MIYFDHAAATDVYPEVKKKVGEYLDMQAGNASSVHRRGKEQRFLIDGARLNVAKLFGVEGKGIVFTSGATEAMTLAVVGGYLGKLKDSKTLKHRNSKTLKIKNRILYSPIAHGCAVGAVQFLEEYFGVEKVSLPLKKDGSFDFPSLKEMDLLDFDMIVCEHGNSEIGVLQDVKRLGERIRKVYQAGRPLFVCDTAASVVSCPGVFDMGTVGWRPDILVLSGEKIGSIGGTGCLVLTRDFPLQPLQFGSHEFGKRGGTENTLGIVAFSEALGLHYEDRQKIHDDVCDLYAYADHLIQEKIPELIKVSAEMMLGHILVYLLPEGKKADLFVTQCDMAGLCISSGSACSSGAVSGNKALGVLTKNEDLAGRAIRLSFGRSNMKEELDRAVEILRKMFQK